MKDIKGEYRHFKGGLYELLFEANDSESQQEVVVYKSLENGSVWVRPKEMFFEEIERDGKKIKRFKRITK